MSISKAPFQVLYNNDFANIEICPSPFRKKNQPFEPKMLAEVEKFIGDPAGWSKAHGGAAEAAE